MTTHLDSLAVAEDGTVRIDANILRLVVEGLDACARLSLGGATPEQRGHALGVAGYAHTRLQAWIKYSAETLEEMTA